MGMRRSFVKWTPYTSADKLESGRKYMVCSRDGGIGTLYFAEWHDEGDVVQVELKEGFAPDGTGGASPEEKLLEALFGRRRSYVIPEPGFYVMTGDMGVDEKQDNGALEGCREQPVVVGNLIPDGSPYSCPCYWAELPIEPEGVSYGGGGDAQFLTPAVEERARRAEEGLEAAPGAMAVFESMCGKGAAPDAGRIERMSGACVYSLSRWMVAERVLGIWNFAETLGKVPADELRKFSESYFAAPSREEAWKLLDGFAGKHGVPEGSRRYIPLLAAGEIDAGPGFFACRDRILGRGGTHALDFPAVMQEARGMSGMPARLRRVVALKRIGAPEIIITNEVRMCAELEIMRRDSSGASRIARVDGRRFRELYGISPDGTRGSGRCHYGDLELMCMPNGDADGADMVLDGGDEEEKSLPRFRPSWRPNFLAREEGEPIFDFASRQYLRGADGKVLLFGDDAMDAELDRLNGPGWEEALA